MPPVPCHRPGTAPRLLRCGDEVTLNAHSVPGNTFSYYDHVLDTAVLVDAVPPRFRDLGLSELTRTSRWPAGTSGWRRWS
jgi:hypothetical protein